MPEEEGRKVYKVTELSRDIKTVLENAFPGVWVEGEISNFRVYPSGHAYFTLKDEEAQIRAVMWKGMRTRLKFEPKDGDHVVVRGRVAVYEKRGEYQIVAEAMEPKGLGALQAAFETLKKKLAAEGLFDEQRKKPLPYLSWSIGIVTSPRGAAIRDMIRTINRRFPGLRIVLAPAQVQGEGAAESVASAISDMNEYGKVDVIIVGRGGGSLEDLWAFNEEVVARAIFASKIPVVSAVGHETDFTISDFVADVRASTPTAAAEIVAPEKEAMQELLDDMARRITVELRDITESYSREVDDLFERSRRAVTSDLRHSKERLNGVRRHLGALSPAARLAERRAALEGLLKTLSRSLIRARELKQAEARDLSGRLIATRPDRDIARLKEVLERRVSTLFEKTRGAFHDRRRRLDIASGRLGAISPLAVLERGYSIITTPDGKKIHKSVKELSPGRKVRIRMADGAASAKIESGDTSRQEKLF